MVKKLIVLFLFFSTICEAQRPWTLLYRGKSIVSQSAGGVFTGVSTNQSGRTITVGFTTVADNQNAPPTIERATITGTTTKEQTLTANVDGFYSPGAYLQGPTLYQWYRADNFQSSGAAIVGAVNSTYVLTASDVAKYIRVEATPVHAGSLTLTGDPVTSIYTDRVEDNEFNPLTDIVWHSAMTPDGAVDLSTNLYWTNYGSGSNSTQNGSDAIPAYSIANTAVDFEASNNEELILDQPATQFTGGVEVWIRFKKESDNASFSYPIAWTSAQRIEQRASGAIYLSGASCSYTAANGAWIVARFFISQASNTSEFNVNNGTEITNVASSTSAFGTSNGRIGSNSGGTGNRYDGLISHIFIKQGQLSAPDQAAMWTWFSTHANWD